MANTLVKKMIWFVVIWCASVAILGVVAYAIKLML